VLNPVALLVPAAFVLFGAFIAAQARQPYRRYRTVADVLATPEGLEAAGEVSLLRGPVSVTDPAEPAREPPDGEGDGGPPPALWAWRVRRERSGGEGPSRWQTVDGGLAVGAFSVREDWERVRVDGDWLTDALADELGDPPDPFDADPLYFGDPERDVPLGELNFLNRVLERVGLAGDGGVLSNVEASVSVGGETTSPDRYQWTTVRDGDELVVRGELAEAGDGLVLRGTPATQLVVATGDLDAKADRLRSRARRQVGFGVVVAALGVAAVAAALL
jgi:hypothetical protein